jgi:hypothetical protein
MTLKPYKCIRCGYETKEKYRIKDHLYKRKKICPAIENDIELTDEIKQYILDNRIYHLPKEEKPPTIIQNIQYNTTMYNYINKLDTMDKLSKIREYKNIDLVALEFSIENKYIKEIKRLEKDIYKYGFTLKEKDFLNIIDTITNVSDNFEDCNVLYDTAMNKLKLYKGSWESFILEIGVKDLIQLIQDSYLYQYELYLLKKIYLPKILNYREICRYKESLEDYFKFIGIFDVKPYCYEKMNCDILENDDEEYTIEEKCRTLYDKIAIPKSEISKMKKIVTDLIKRNGKNNIKELNKLVIDTMNIDEEFKECILQNLVIT